MPVLSQKVVALMNTNHPLADKEALTFEDLIQYRIYTYSITTLIGNQFRELLVSQGLDIDWNNVFFDYPNELLIAGLLSQEEEGKTDYTKTIGLIANVPYLENFHNIKIIPVSNVPDDFRKVYMIYKTNKFRTHAVELFMEFIEKEYSRN